MSFRPSQDPAYWTSDFQLTPSDIEFLQEYLLARERPVLEGDLADALIEFRFQREEQRIRRELARGTLYQPRESYQVGDTLEAGCREITKAEQQGQRETGLKLETSARSKRPNGRITRWRVSW